MLDNLSFTAFMTGYMAKSAQGVLDNTGTTKVDQVNNTATPPETTATSSATTATSSAQPQKPPVKSAIIRPELGKPQSAIIKPTSTPTQEQQTQPPQGR